MAVEMVTIGPHKLYLGDCLEVIADLDANSVDATVTSPPYNQMSCMMGKPSGMRAESIGGLGFNTFWKSNGYRDDMKEDDYQLWQNKVFGTIVGVSRTVASLFYNHQVRWRERVCLHPVDWFKPDGWNLRQEIIWNRFNGMMLNARMFCRFDERILWFVKDGWKWNQESTTLGTVWDIACEQQQRGKKHPVAFPLAIPERCIAAATDQDDVVLDPFMGSGTTGVASQKLGRRFIGIEIERRYFDIACKRIERAMQDTAMFDRVDPPYKPVEMF